MGVARSPGGKGTETQRAAATRRGDELGAGAFLSLVRGGALLKAQNLRREAVRNLQQGKGITMSILQIIVMFIVFCIVWIVTNLINQALVGKVQQVQQRQRIDLAYAQISRLIVRAIAEVRGAQRNDKM